ncbi:MAG: hypothetical protein M1820_008737 [Bogoriella megaspora]|nr:MAG: hypothetical protein M1820_008737 [Bogoriella megaspora]
MDNDKGRRRTHTQAATPWLPLESHDEEIPFYPRKPDQAVLQLRGHQNILASTIVPTSSFDGMALPTQGHSFDKWWSAGSNLFAGRTILDGIHAFAMLILCLFKTYLATPAKSNWPGWNRIETLFVFGDSYSTTEFNIAGKQPSHANPLGNPAYPGGTSSNGPNWVDFLTTTYNESFVQTYNLAVGGATVDSDLVKPFLPTVPSLKQQVEDRFVSHYAHSGPAVWKANTTLFSIFIGINDVGNSFQRKGASLNAAILNAYSTVIDQLYKYGARNFLFLNVIPMDRVPRTVDGGRKSIRAARECVIDFNLRIDKMVANFTKTYADVTAFQFDTHALFSQVLNNPTVFPETKAYENVTDWCGKYERGTKHWDSFDKACGVKVDEHLWLNNLHPTYPVHNATARQIALQLGI